MPHCIIEHSIEVNGDELIPLVHQGAAASELFELNGSDIKVRSIPYSNYKTGNTDLYFVHVTLRILSGRSLDEKSNLSQLILNQLEQAISQKCSISIEVVDIDRETYAKTVFK